MSNPNQTQQHNRSRKPIAVFVGAAGAAALGGTLFSAFGHGNVAATPEPGQTPTATAQANQYPKADPEVAKNVKAAADVAANTILSEITTQPSSQQHWSKTGIEMHLPGNKTVQVSIRGNQLNVNSSQKTPAGYDCMNMAYKLNPETQAMTATNLGGAIQGSQLERVTVVGGGSLESGNTILAGPNGSLTDFTGTATMSTEGMQQALASNGFMDGVYDRHPATQEDVNNLTQQLGGDSEALPMNPADIQKYS